MSLCSYPNNGPVSTIAPGHHACILQLHLTSNHVFIRRILSAMSVTIAPSHFPYLKQLHPTSSHTTLQTCAYKHACLIHLHQTSIRICYSNIQPSVLSVALATDQKNSNFCYNCTGQAGLYQPAVKMVTNICSMQIPYSGVVFLFVCKFYPSIQLTFFRPLIQKRFVL